MSRKKNKVAIVALVLLAIVTVCVIGSCEADTKGVSGTVNIAGSSALLPLAQSAAKTFMDKNPDSVINTNGGGSGQGLQQVSDGTIDIIATDHAPHSREEKERSITAAPSGIIGLETALALGITSLVRPGHLTLMQLLEKMTVIPLHCTTFPPVRSKRDFQQTWYSLIPKKNGPPQYTLQNPPTRHLQDGNFTGKSKPRSAEDV